MKTSPTPATASERFVRLRLAEVGPSLERHPNDGFRLADPYPLGAAALRTLRALVLALCPPAPAPHSADLMNRVELGARRLLRYMHPVVARTLALGLALLDWLPLLTLTSGLRLHRLDGARARKLLGKWARSPFRLLRLLIVGLRGLVLCVYFDQSEVHAAMRYAPVPFLKSRLAKRALLLNPTAATPLAAE
jgi:hypothetical protein